MTYDPNNVQVFTAAFSGALAGMGASNKTPVSTNSESDVNVGLANVAGAFAQEFDSLYSGATTTLAISTIQELCESVWQQRVPQFSPPFTTPVTYEAICQALIAIVQAGIQYAYDQDIPDDESSDITSWQEFEVNFNTSNDDGSLGDGDLQGFFRIVGSDTMEIAVSLKPGAETDMGTGYLVFGGLPEVNGNAIIVDILKIPLFFESPIPPLLSGNTSLVDGDGVATTSAYVFTDINAIFQKFGLWDQGAAVSDGDPIDISALSFHCLFPFKEIPPEF